jgi:hypothetical protein
VIGLVPIANDPLPAVVPGDVPGVVGDTGASIGAGKFNGALGTLGLKVGGGGGGEPIAPICASAAAHPAKAPTAASVSRNASLAWMMDVIDMARSSFATPHPDGYTSAGRRRSPHRAELFPFVRIWP